MEDLKYFIVQVKLEMETDQCDKAGNPKMKKWKETWCVRAESTKHADEIVRETIARAYETAVQILNDNKADLEKAAQYLLEKETITGQEFMEIISEGEA